MRILMCPPAEYKVLWEINPWMNKKNQPDKEKSWNQWHSLFEVYQKLRFKIFLIPPAKNLADMVFTANAGWGRKGSFLLSNFRCQQRRRETEFYKKWFKEHGFKTFSLPKNIYFEGQADIVTLKEAYLFGQGIRSSLLAKDFLQKKLFLQKPVIPIKIINERFFHLDTCLFYIAPIDTILYFPGAFDRESLVKIRKLKADKIEVSQKEASDFICNGIYYEDTVVLNKNSNRLVSFLKKKDLETIIVESSEFKKAGGGIRCLTLFLD